MFMYFTNYHKQKDNDDIFSETSFLNNLEQIWMTCQWFKRRFSNVAQSAAKQNKYYPDKSLYSMCYILLISIIRIPLISFCKLNKTNQFKQIIFLFGLVKNSRIIWLNGNVIKQRTEERQMRWVCVTMKKNLCIKIGEWQVCYFFTYMYRKWTKCFGLWEM